MVIPVLSPAESAGRVREVRARLQMGSVELSLALAQDKQYISRLEKAQRKRWDRAEKVKLAEFAAGRGDFHSTSAFEILRFLEGEINFQVNLVPAIEPFDGTPSAPADDGTRRVSQGDPDLLALAPAS